MVHGVSLYFKQLMQMHNTFKIIIGIVDIITDEIHDENILLGFGVCEGGGGGVVVKSFLTNFFLTLTLKIFFIILTSKFF